MIDLEEEIALLKAAVTELAARVSFLEELAKAAPDHDDVFRAPQAEYDRAAAQG